MLLLLCVAGSVAAVGEVEMCPPRPDAGSVVNDPPVLSSEGGALTLDLTMVNSPGSDGIMQYCYVYGDGSTEAPTLMMNPGDTLTLNLTNHLVANPSAKSHMTHQMAGPASSDPCHSVAMSDTSTNVHFHGLNVPPKCHQDDVIRTTIQPNSAPFQYKIQIPANEPPGLYWYHPHPHGFTKTQVAGGAAGALIVGGVEKMRPEVAGLPQRVFVVREKPLPGGSDESSVSSVSSVTSVNFVPFRENRYARILIKPSEKQLWRIVNATSTQFLQLAWLSEGLPTNVEIVGLDGVPLETIRTVDTVMIPPAGRAEVIIQGPPRNGLVQWFNMGFDTGPGGDYNPAKLLANVVPSNDAPEPPLHMPVAGKRETLQRFAGLTHQAANRERKLYFTETDDGVQFFLTVKGQTPKVYDPQDPPAIVTRQGSIEDWTLENRTTEVHAFHLHQLHFVVLEVNGKPTHDDAVRDTILVPYWDGVSPKYTSVKIRVDFRDPETVGTFLYHCHILDHEDGGMMAKIQVVASH